MLAPVVLAALFAPVCHGKLAPPTPVERYLARRRGLEAGISIEDDWPRRPYLQVLVTRDAEVHEPALRRRYRYRLRVVEVLHPDAELRAVEERIQADDDAPAAEGFDVRLAYYDVEQGRVYVQMISARSDHQAYFAARYGPYVETFAVPDEKQPACAKLDGVRVSSTGRSLLQRWTSSTGDVFSHVELTERADRVEVGIVRRVPVFGGPDDAHEGRVRVQLSRPLGERRVIDAATGREP